MGLYPIKLLFFLLAYVYSLFWQGVVCLPSKFGADFGDQIGRFATLIDPKDNQ